MQFTAKTVNEAKEMGLKELNITEEQAEITIIEQPTKGLFGRLKGQAVVEITKKEEDIVEEKEVFEDKEQEDQMKALEFVEKISSLMDLNVKAQLSNKDGSTIITLISDDSSNVIGYRGEVLDAIQTLAGAAMNIGKKEYKKVVVDCENYRDKREETLIKLAKRLEEKATDMRREVMLEPMSPYERRIIHTTLSNSQTCTTKSEGKEPNRYVVIVPNDKDEFSKPYNAGRNHSDHGGKGGRRDNKKGGGFKKGGRRESRQSGFSEVKRKTPSGFGTYLGNSLKDKQ